jgi:uncharacterized repeat protein (TIGR01451 family)
MVIAFTAVVAVALALPSFASALTLQETSQSPLENLTGVSSIATGDFNEDGADDMAVGEETGVVVEISNGDGTFTEGETLPIEAQTNASVTSVVVGDFNGDGNLDIAYADGPYKVYIALGNGDGTFEAPDSETTFNTPGYIYPGCLAAGELGLGSGEDLVMAAGVHSEGYESSQYQVIGDVAGSFTAGSLVPVTIPLKSSFVGVAVGDYNGDGDQDLALLTQPFSFGEGSGNQIYGEEGQGDGIFVPYAQNPISPGVGSEGYARAEATANLDGSGGDDLLVAISDSSGHATVPLLGSSTEFLTLHAAGALSDPGLPNAVAAGELTGSGTDDAVTAIFDGEGTVTVGQNDGAGNLTAAPGSPFKTAQAHFFNSAVAVGDFNGDGYPDVAIASNANTNGGPLTQGVAVMMNSAAVTVSTQKIEFGTVETGHTAIEGVNLTSLGAVPTVVSDIELSGAAGSPFALGDPTACETGSLPEGGECEIEVEFTPTAEAESTDMLKFTTDTGTNGAPVVHEVPLSGEGVAPAATLSPASQDFGSVQVGAAPVTKTFTIRSTGSAPLSISSVSLSSEADFTLGSPTSCVKSINRGRSCEVSVTFSPTGAAGARTATLTFATNAGNQTAQLSGTATAPASTGGGTTTAPSPKAAAKLKVKAPATAKAGKTISLKVTITNSGNTALSGLALTVKVPAKLAGAPKSVKVGSLGVGKSVTKTIKVKVKPGAAKGSKIAIALGATAGGKTLAKASGKVKVK